MVAILSQGKSLRSAFYYNEHKVSKGKAELLHAENYPLSADALSENQRLQMLVKQAALRPGTEVNSLHITLNFDPSEKLSEQKLIDITRVYMEKIGFGNQPYLIYQHNDAGHPHVHIVTTNIEASGEAINLHRLGIDKSNPARKEIESLFKLVKAEEQAKQNYQLKSAYAATVIYGRSESRAPIHNVLEKVLKTYKYSSLPELNALLNQYNIQADRGSEQSRIYKNGGLVYRILDDSGRPVGVPIKASAFYDKPTLTFLQERFESNDKEKQSRKNNTKNAIDSVFRSGRITTITQLRERLSEKGIHMAVMENEQGIIYGITYVDHTTKCIFKGSDLGKNYSTKGILEQLEGQKDIVKRALKQQYSYTDQQLRDISSGRQLPELRTGSEEERSLLYELMHHEGNPDYVPYELRKKKKKKSKGRSIND